MVNHFEWIPWMFQSFNCLFVFDAIHPLRLWYMIDKGHEVFSSQMIKGKLFCSQSIQVDSIILSIQ